MDGDWGKLFNSVVSIVSAAKKKKKELICEDFVKMI